MSGYLMGWLGIAGLMAVAWGCSVRRRRVNWRVVFWGVVLQFIFAALIFKLPAGYVFFNWINGGVVTFLSFAREGMYFLFGPLAVSPGETGPCGESSPGFILAFQALPAIIFFSALMSLLYFLKIMPLLVRIFAGIFSRLMRISGAESLCASSNIFVGIESALTIRPFLAKMTNSELCTVLTTGMGTIASTVLALYVSFLYKDFPTIAGHLVSASLLSAPACIVMAKLIYPENRAPQTLDRLPKIGIQRAESWVEAVISGANDGMKLCVGIVALLLAALGLLAGVNWLVARCGYGLGALLGRDIQLSLQNMLSWVFYPLARLTGAPAYSALPIAQLLGERVIVTELVGYRHLAEFIRAGVIRDTKSIVIAAYALCGFAHIASLAIFVGGISALVPERARDLSRMAFRALLAATLACLMTAAVAGIFFSDGPVLLGTMAR